MTRYIRLIAQATAAAFLLVLTGASAALAGPAPIEPEFPPPAATTTDVTAAGAGFPWMLTSAITLLVIAVVALSVVLWQRHRTHTVHNRLVTP